MSKKVVGIDPGTTMSAVAGLPKGRPELAPNANNEPLMPSAVLYVKENGHVRAEAVGLPADRRKEIQPENVVRRKKPELNEDDAEVFGGAVEPRDYPRQIGKKLHENAEAYFNTTIEDVVVTRPVWFSQLGNQRLREAFEELGLNVLHQPSEPAAAGYAAFIEQPDLDGKHVFFDFGGGTFDVAIYDVDADNPIDGGTIVANDGSLTLGGDDIDLALLRHLVERFQEEFPDSDPLGDPHQRTELLEKATAVKVDLSFSNEAQVRISADEGSTVLTVTRAEFEELINDFLLKMRQHVETALHKANCAPDEVNGVHLMGGSTRIPAVQAMVADVFGADAIMDLVDKDKAVVHGAACMAGKLSPNGENPRDKRGRPRLKDPATETVPQSIGVAIVEDEATMGEVNRVIVPQGESLPASGKLQAHPLTNDAQWVALTLLLGDATDPARCEILVQDYPLGIEVPRHRDDVLITITVYVDENYLIHFYAEEDSENGNRIYEKLDHPAVQRT